MRDPSQIKILIGCETSGMVRRAFLDRGFDAWSCDLLPSDDASNRHIVADVRDLLNDGWNMLALMHPPCTRLCNSGVRWLTEPPSRLTDVYPLADRISYQSMSRDERLEFMWKSLAEGAALFSSCWNAPIEHIAVENPVMHRHAKMLISNYQPPAQTVQPWWFGARAFKATSFFLRDLPPLIPTNKLVPPKPGTEEHKEWSKIHRASRTPDRWKIRSETFPEIAAAVASQWGDFLLQHRS